jgi:hypothetical protein
MNSALLRGEVRRRVKKAVLLSFATRSEVNSIMKVEENIGMVVKRAEVANWGTFPCASAGSARFTTPKITNMKTGKRNEKRRLRGSLMVSRKFLFANAKVFIILPPRF